MKRVGLAEARDHLSLLVNDAAHGHQRILIESHGRPKAALVGLQDLERLRRLAPQVDGESNPMLRWLEETEKILRRQSPLVHPTTTDALDEIREGKIAERAGLYRRQRRPKPTRRRRR